jgi:hypothetical protein
VQNVRPVVCWTGNGPLQRDTIKALLGQIATFTSTTDSMYTVAVEHTFDCEQNKDWFIYGITFDSKSQTVYVALGNGGARDEGRIIKYDSDGKIDGKKAAITGRVCLGGLGNGWVLIEGKEIKPKVWLRDSLLEDDNKTGRKYDMYNKGNTQYAVRVHSSGACDFRAVTLSMSSNYFNRKICDLAVKNPVAMDVSKDGKFLAVLEESYADVKIFQVGNSVPCAIYRAHRQSFKPLDVCFFTIDKKEFLIIADWLNDVLHLLDVNDGCKMIGHLGADCSLLVKPSALYPDVEKPWLWIGCQGGLILTLSVSLTQKNLTL